MDKIINILIVDDDPNVRAIIRDFLGNFKTSVSDAENAFNLIQIIREKSIDLLMLDIMMDHKSGFQGLKEVRKYYPDLPIIMISSNDDYLRLAMKHGATDRLSKPINLDDLEDKLWRFIGI